MNMMEYLYDSYGYVKMDKLDDALKYAKSKGRLPGVDEVVMREFVAGCEEIAAMRHGDFQDKIDQREMKKILELLEQNHTDHVREEHLDLISEIVLDKHYQFSSY